MRPFSFGFLLCLPLLAFSQPVDTTLAIQRIDSLLAVAASLEQAGNFQAAKDTLEAALEYAESRIGRENEAASNCLNRLGVQYEFLGDFEKAETLYLEAKAIREKILGKDHPHVGLSLMNLGIVNWNKGEYEAAEAFIMEAMKIQEAKVGKEHVYYGKCIINLSGLYAELGRFEDAEGLGRQGLETWEKVSGKKSRGYAQMLNNIGIAQMNLGKYEQAISSYTESLAIINELQGKFNMAYTRASQNLGVLYSRIGSYLKADSFLESSVDVVRQLLGQEHVFYARILADAGTFYLQMGFDDKALHFLSEALKIYERTDEKESRHYATALYNAGGIYKKSGDLEQAEYCFLESKKIQENTSLTGHTNYANCLISLGWLHFDQGDMKKAGGLFGDAHSIIKEAVGINHNSYAYSLKTLGAYHFHLKEFEAAQQYFSEALDIYGKTFGKDSKEYAACEVESGANEWALGNPENAAELFRHANSAENRVIAENARHFPEQELSKFKKETEKSFDYLFSISSETGKAVSSLRDALYNDVLFKKGFLQQAALQLRQVAEEAPEEVMEVYYEWKSIHRRLAAEYSKPIAERQDVEILQEQADALEKGLVRKMAGFGEALRQVNWREVQGRLRPGEAAIEFVHYNYLRPAPTDSVLYAALVLRPGDDHPQFVPLFEESQLEAMLHQQHTGRQQYFSQLYAPPANDGKGSLYELIWEPLDSLLNGHQTVYLSPAGLLHRINLGAVRVDEINTLGDQYNIAILGSTRQLALDSGQASHSSGPPITNNQSTTNPQPSAAESSPGQAVPRPPSPVPSLSAAIYGGIQYDMDSTALAQAAAPDTRLAYHSSGLSFRDAERNERGRRWRYLNGTEQEAQKIGAIVSELGGDADLYSAYEATEESFKGIGRIGPSPYILHLATHGYFYPDPAGRPNAYPLRGGGEGAGAAFKISDHPMIRSGLVFAGGNHVWKGNPPLPGLEDGILTAYEASQVNLRNTELVVLSACETGLGDIEGNEGVYGLQRAFKIAGARYLLMSLWPVPDAQTQELMVAFYRHWLEEGMEIPQAFRLAQQEMRRRHQEHYYWAAFVLVE